MNRLFYFMFHFNFWDVEMGKNIEPEGQTSSDNFDVSATKTEQDFLRSQSEWGELNADDEAYLRKKGLNSPCELLRSYRELEKAYSSKITLPKDGDKEAFQKLYSRLGMPEDISGFEINFAKEDETFGDDFKRVCLDNNILPKSAQALYDWYVKNRAEQADKFEQDRIAQSEIDREEQQQAWGNQSAFKIELMKRGVRLFTEGDDSVVDAMEQALGTKRMMQIFAKLGEAVSEDNPVSFGNVDKRKSNFSLEEYFREMFNDYS